MGDELEGLGTKGETSARISQDHPKPVPPEHTPHYWRYSAAQRAAVDVMPCPCHRNGVKTLSMPSCIRSDWRFL